MFFAQTKNPISKLDSTLYYRSLSKKSSLSKEERLAHAIKSSNLAKRTKVDSTILSSNRNLSVLYYITRNFNLFKKINQDNLRLAVKLKDSSALVAANRNLGVYYDNNSQNDSAFYYYSKTLKLYDNLQQSLKKVEVLVNIADIQETEKDYFGSEETAVEAIKLLNTLPKDEIILDQLWILNNLIGIISFKLKKYDRSLEYHSNALEISNRMDDGYFNSLYSTNNQAYVYRLKGELDTSISLYQSVLDTKNLYEEDPLFYALILTNTTYAKSLKENRNIAEIEQSFQRAYKIGDSLKDPMTKLGATIDFSKFYIDIDEKEKALAYAKESYELAKETSSNDIVLESLLLLSKLKNGEAAKKYLNEHIKLSDSLLNVERDVRNKFARITLETDQLEAENERITLQKIWLSIVSIVLLLTLFLLYIIITQRAKNKELKFKQVQQEANEEIYNLMLSQQDKVDEARAGEKKRISEELHDGVLGRLFGTRLSLDSFNFNEGKEAVANRSKYINELKIIEEDIRKISHDLNTDFVSGSEFIDILSELIEKQTLAYQLKFDFKHTDDINWESVSNKTKINIYRIIQESLQNIYKHANADTVKISIRLKNDVICLIITDDGDGFDINRSKKGIGLKNISSRVDELLGTVDFDSEINKGTAIKINVPYSNN
ncbi:two-component sensor histidine kinase [Flavobacteriales bacterium 34_180_T64]|nr:two-component sensor histidine kinase [Flavobacteriales bacterium 34_180_T64]